MTLRAVSKKKRAVRPLTCPECRGEMKPHVVQTTQRDGRVMDGIEVRHVECETCDSTGKVRSRMAKACCCSGPEEDRCEGCANARRGGSEVHNCSKASEDEIAFETELAFMDSPRAGAKTSDAARSLDLGVGERSGQRGNR